MRADRADRPLVWLHGEIRSPPFSTDARVEAGELLRRSPVQQIEASRDRLRRYLRDIGER